MMLLLLLLLLLLMLLLLMLLLLLLPLLHAFAARLNFCSLNCNNTILAPLDLQDNLHPKTGFPLIIVFVAVGIVFVLFLCPNN